MQPAQLQGLAGILKFGIQQVKLLLFPEWE